MNETEGTQYRVVRKDRTTAGTRQRGVTHLVHDRVSNQTWCGRKFRGVYHQQHTADLGVVTCSTCLAAFKAGRARSWSRH